MNIVEDCGHRPLSYKSAAVPRGFTPHTFPRTLHAHQLSACPQQRRPPHHFGDDSPPAKHAYSCTQSRARDEFCVRVLKASAPIA